MVVRNKPDFLHYDQCIFERSSVEQEPACAHQCAFSCERSCVMRYVVCGDVYVCNTRHNNIVYTFGPFTLLAVKSNFASA